MAKSSDYYWHFESVFAAYLVAPAKLNWMITCNIELVRTDRRAYLGRPPQVRARIFHPHNCWKQTRVIEVQVYVFVPLRFV
jgi:hypothetical protein